METALKLPSGNDASEFLAALEGRTVLGINPPVYDFAWFDLWSKPMGLLMLLDFLRRRGNSVHLLDCMHAGRTTPRDFGRWKVERVEVEKPLPYRAVPRKYRRFGLNAAALRERLAALPRPEIVLVTSVMTYWYIGVFDAVRAVREVFPGVPVLLGGIYAQLCPEHARGSGANFIQSAPLALPLKRAAMDLYDDLGYGVLLTSRGCPMRCDYCASRILSPSFRLLPLEEVFEDLSRQLESSSISDLAFYDDALLWNREEHFYPLCRGLREVEPRLRVHTPNGMHVAQMDENCCRVLFETGFHTLRLSLEGIDPATAAAGSGKVAATDYARAVKNLIAAGYTPDRIETYILAGLPGQRFEDVMASVAYVKGLGGRPKIAEFSPIPGTPLYREALRKKPELATEPLLHNNTVYAEYVGGNLTSEEMQTLKNVSRA